MERYPWIREEEWGEELPEKGLLALLDRVNPEDRALAFFVHCFRAVRADRLQQLLSEETVENLLELRLFSAERELWAHRSALGEHFSWRIASETGLTASDFFETRQTLDIDTKHAPEGEGLYGARPLRTTGGGEYALPIGEDDGCVVLVNYVAYDEDGCAFAADWRVKGFEAQKTIHIGKEA